MKERLRFQGRLAEQKMIRKRLELKIKALRTALREALDPFEAIGDLPGEEISVQAMDLAAALVEYRGCVRTIAEIKKALGR